MADNPLEGKSPEEILEYQKKNCIFCHIINGRVPSHKVYEDDKVLAILDINPANVGHILLLPKEHYSLLPQIPDKLIRYMFVVAKYLSSAVVSTLGAKGVNIFVANGVGAGQRAPHFMIHIIPRFEGDNIKSFELPGYKIDDKILREIGDNLILLLKKQFESKKEKKPPEEINEKQELNLDMSKLSDIEKKVMGK